MKISDHLCKDEEFVRNLEELRRETEAIAGFGKIQSNLDCRLDWT